MNISVKDASKLLSVSEKTIYRWLKSGLIPAYKLNESYRFNRAELLQWATSRRIGVPPESFTETDNQIGPLPSLFAALEAGGVYYRLEGKTRDDVLANAVSQLRLPEEANRQHLTQALIAREKLASTALGNGIAIPHPRSPGISYVSRSTVTLFFLEKPVSFASLDGRLTTILFVISTANVREHLHLLSKLAFVLRNDHFLALLDSQASREQLYSGLKRSEDSLTKRHDLATEDSGL